MKKILISLLLINLFMVNINAETYEADLSIPLSMNVKPSYCVKIPKTINISNNTTYFNYYVSGDIYADKYLQVLFDEQTTIYSKDSECIVYVSQNKTIFSANELTSSYSQCMACISHNNLESGNWRGTLNVVISLIGGV